jgi:hypothetical protein
MSANPSKWKRDLGYAWHQFCLRHSYWIVLSADRQRGFVSHGSESAVSHFIRYYLDGDRGVKVRRKWRWSGPTKAVLDRDAKRFGLAVTTDAMLGNLDMQGLIEWPRMVEVVLELPATMEEYRRLLSTSAKSDIRRLQRDEITMRVSRDWADWEDFYHEFYVPSMRGRHGEDTRLYPLSNFREIHACGTGNELVEAWVGGERAGAMVCQSVGAELHMRRLGWRQGGRIYYHKSVLGSLYWFAACRAIEMGHRRVVFGGVHPYLESGWFFFKLKWGGRLSMAYSNFDAWRVAIDPVHRDSQAFFEKYSLLIKNTQTQKFDVLSAREPREVYQAQKLAGQLGEWTLLGATCAKGIPKGEGE